MTFQNMIEICTQCSVYDSPPRRTHKREKESTLLCIIGPSEARLYSNSIELFRGGGVGTEATTRGAGQLLSNGTLRLQNLQQCYITLSALKA